MNINFFITLSILGAVGFYLIQYIKSVIKKRNLDNKETIINCTSILLIILFVLIANDYFGGVKNAMNELIRTGTPDF